MRVAEAADVKELAAWSEEWCVSAFIPAHQPEGRQDGDLLRLKNMLRSAGRELSALGMRQPAAAGLLEPVMPTELTDRSAPEFHRGGVALFASPGVTRSFRVPIDMPELVTVGRRFHLKPLVAALAKDRRFFFLTLTKGNAQVRLGGLDGLEPVEIPDMPSSFADVARFDEASDSARWDELNRSDHLPEDVLRYVRAVETAVTAALPGDPLVIGGTDALVSAYVDMTGYRSLVAPPLTTNPDALANGDLHSAALELVAARSAAAVARDGDRFAALHGTGRASGQLDVVLAAARAGRIDTVFVASDTQVWGIPALGAAAVAVHETRMPGDDDLLDRVAVNAWRSAATIHIAPCNEIPGTTGVAALFRY